MFNSAKKNAISAFLDKNSFISLILKIYSNDFNERMKFIFDLYDFDNDGYVTKEDVLILLSSVKIDSSSNQNIMAKEGKISQLGEGREEFKDRAESQKELRILVETSFQDKTKINFADFSKIIETKCSDMFICLYANIRKQLPYMSDFENFDKSNFKKLATPKQKIRTLLASPKTSKFYPFEKSAPPKFDFDVSIGTGNKVTNLDQINMKAFEFAKIMAGEFNQDITPANKYELSQDFSSFGHSDDSKSINSLTTIETTEMNKMKKVNSVQLHNFQKSMSGYLYKIKSKEKFKKGWFRLEKKILLYYEKEMDEKPRKLIALVNCFLEEDLIEQIDKIDMETFSLYFKSKTIRLGARTKKEYEEWLSAIKISIGYSMITDYYDFIKKVADGKFGIVRVAKHKKTKNIVAIKSIDKSKLKEKEKEMTYREVEVLKLCQHPNIIRLYDVFESKRQIHLVMEWIEGGDLFTYAEKNKFIIPEERVRTIINSLASALYYLHSFGIIHRDIKPENILLLTKDNDSDIKIADFGLSRIIGPNEKLKESYGTLGYCAPEILMNLEHDKAIDIWSLGIVTHFLLVGFLPFDSLDENELKEKTIYDELDISSCRWKNKSENAKDFIKSCLRKNPSNRISTIDVLKHAWFANLNSLKLNLQNLNQDAFEIFSTPKFANQKDIFFHT